jgi:hypothetical protein
MVGAAGLSHDRCMHTHRRLIRFTTACVAIATLGLAGCGGGGSKAASTTTTTAPPAEASESAYCDTAREWQVHELVPFDGSDPAATKKYVTEWVAFATEAEGQAPDELRTDWQLNRRALVDTVVPLFEKYGYSQARAEAEATDAELALFEEPPPDVAQAQDRIHAYEDSVCAAAQPEAADVEFTGAGSKQYCEAVVASEEAADEVEVGGMPAEEVRALVTSSDYRAGQDAIVAHAPAAIHDDVVAVREFDTSQWEPLLKRNNYDFVRVFLDGSQHEREILQHRVPEVSTAWARITAYDEQVCGVE